MWEEPGAVKRSNCLFKFVDAGSGTYSLQLAYQLVPIFVMCTPVNGICGANGDQLHLWSNLPFAWTLHK